MKTRIGVLMGGLSSEREVSLETGAGVFAALRERGYECVAIDWAEDTSLPKLLEEARVGVVWNALHGTYGEDGAVQGLLACMNIACTGSGILASSLAMDKIASKRIFESHDLPTPRWTSIPIERALAPSDMEELAVEWPPPVVIKPANEGSSVGVTILHDPARLYEAIARARACHGPTLLEAFIPGAEIHVGILGDEVIGAIEVKPAVQFYDYEAKYKRNDTEYIIPATIPANVISQCKIIAQDAYRALGCAGYGRVDVRVDDAGRAYLLEVNTLPGMTSHSLLPKIAAHAGIDYPSLCERILKSARNP